MVDRERLGGFKVLKNVARMSLVSPPGDRDFPARVFRVIANEKINLPYAACIFHDPAWGLTIAVEDVDISRASAALKTHIDHEAYFQPAGAILSLFPHKKKPEITRALFEAFGREGILTEAFANSPSAISIVLDEESVDRASSALFGPFSFSAYRTPADWKLAQKGKEQLYKEVVASYQEQRPKVYGLEHQDQQTLFRVQLNRMHLERFSNILQGLAAPGAPITFLATSPCRKEGKENIFFCLPDIHGHSRVDMLNASDPFTDFRRLSPVATFSMNGPHFGDRYGIVSELLTALECGRVELLGLSCTIASITGVIPAVHLAPAIEAIQDRFDIPSVIQRT